MSSLSPTPDQPATTDRKGTPIEYKEYLTHDTHVTGIAYYSNPQGLGNFRIYVSGQPEAVDRFAQEASIISMQVAPARDEDFVLMRERQEAACKRRIERQQVHEAALKKFADKEYVASLPEEERRDLARNAAEPGPEHHSAEPNLKRDRWIQIEVLDRFDPKVPHFLSYTIDPSVARGTCDLWSLFNGNVLHTSATLIWTGGDPDLYLFLNGNEADRSIHGFGQGEDVDAGGSGAWKLHIYGYSDGSSYEIRSIDLWYQDLYGNDVPDSH